MVSAYTAFAMRVFGMEQLFGSVLRQYNVIRGIGVVGQLDKGRDAGRGAEPRRRGSARSRADAAAPRLYGGHCLGRRDS